MSHLCSVKWQFVDLNQCFFYFADLFYTEVLHGIVNVPCAFYLMILNSIWNLLA
jgi:hypothetical protein